MAKDQFSRQGIVILRGIIGAGFTVLICAVVMAAAFTSGLLPIGVMTLTVILIAVLSGIMCGLAAANKADRQKLPLAFAAAALYLLLIFVLRGLAFHTVGEMPWLVALCTMGGCLVGAIISAKKQKSHKRRI